MSITSVIELSHELRRLAIAGVGLARGDRRIADLLPALERAGEKVPVFARIAERASALLDAPKARAPGDFLALNTLVGAVLKTQGQTAVDGELAPLPPSACAPMRIAARSLNELHACFGGGRMETLRDALARGWFGDARLVPFALDALRSEHAELANLAAEEMLPAYGRAIVPELVAALDLERKRPASRLVETIRRIDPPSAAALARQILDPEAEVAFGIRTRDVAISDDALVAALRSLGDAEDDRLIAREFLGARRRRLRTAALERLLALGDEAARQQCLGMLRGSSTKVREALESLPRHIDEETSDAVQSVARELASRPPDAKPSANDTSIARHAALALVGQALDRERLHLVLVLLGNLRQPTERFDVTELHTLLARLIECCDASEHEAVSRTAMQMLPGHAILVAIRRFGPADALGFVSLAQPADLARGLDELDAGLLEAALRQGHELPPPERWGAGWLALALRTERATLVGHLWRADPELVVATVLGKKHVLDSRLLLQVLIADPRAAPRLRKRLPKWSRRRHGNRPDLELLGALCAALVAGDGEAHLTMLEECSGAFEPHRLRALRERLAELADARPGPRPADTETPS